MKLIDLGTRLGFRMINYRDIMGKVGMFSDRSRLSLWCRDEKVEDHNEHLTMNSLIIRNRSLA